MFILRRSCRRSVFIPAKGLYVQAGAGKPVMDLSSSVDGDILWTNDSQALGFQDVIQNVSISDAKELTVKSTAPKSHGIIYSVQGKQNNNCPPRSLTANSMLGYINRQQGKYNIEALHQYQPSRHLTTSTVHMTSSVQGSQHYEFDHHQDPSPQGIQGDDCVEFKLWMENCQRYSLPNCDEQMQAIRTGRKTLAEVFMEQQLIIEKVAEDWRKRNQDKSKLGHISSQGVQDGGYNFEFSDLNDPCPQGLQGDDCANYKVWSHNCKALGFGDCAEQLHSVRQGQKTLQDIFDDQDQLIRKVVKDFQQKRNYSTSSKSEVRSSDSPTSNSNSNPSKDGDTSSPDSTPPTDGNSNLSRKVKLKRAVKEYGSTVIVFHIGISLISLGGFYLVVSSGIDVVGLLTSLGIGQSILSSKIGAGSTTFVISYAVHKVFAPIRIGITLTCAPMLVRHLRKIGFLKPPKTKKTGTTK